MPHIEGPRVFLREFRRDDIPVIHSWVNDPEILRFLSWGIFPQTQKETERFVEAQMSGEDPLSRVLVISLQEGDTCIGTTGCHNIDWRNRSAELGIVIGKPEYLGKGYGTEATELLLDLYGDCRPGTLRRRGPADHQVDILWLFVGNSPRSHGCRHCHLRTDRKLFRRTPRDNR